MGNCHKKGKGKLPIFCGNGERHIPFYGRNTTQYLVNFTTEYLCFDTGPIRAKIPKIMYLHDTTITNRKLLTITVKLIDYLGLETNLMWC